MPSGVEIDAFRLSNRRGMETQIITYGGIVTRLMVEDREGRFSDVVLGHDTLAEYLANNQYFGGLIGRFANRIAGGAFTLDGKHRRLARNDGSNSLHGGMVGFDKVVWTATEAVATSECCRLRLEYVSRDGEEGYPGTLSVAATYTLTEDNRLTLDFSATTDKSTVVNLTQHSYFNLAGRGDVLGHLLQINADVFAVLDDVQIPTGELRAVAGSPFDFRQARTIGASLDASDPQLRLARGYDHHWVARKPPQQSGLVATVMEPASGRRMDVFSSAPGLQFYSGNSLDGRIKGKDGRSYTAHSGLCLEPQHCPDSPNQPAFPSVILRPTEAYTHAIIYRFSAH
jgi:aldose 1-epimerase